MVARRTQALWHEAISVASLDQILETYIRAETAPGRDGLRKTALPDDFTRRLHSALVSGRYRFSAYRMSLHSKGPGKVPRMISIPSLRDRVVMKAMAQTLNEIEPNTRTKLPQQVIAELLKEFKGEGWDHFLKLDIKDFYPSVPHSELERCLSQTLNFDRLERLFMNAVRTPTAAVHAPRSEHVWPTGGIPQGLPLSNGLAELILMPVDAQLDALDNVFATRYVDDILIVSRSGRDLSEIRSVVSKSIDEKGLALHANGAETAPGKSSTGMINEDTPLQFLGYSFRSPTKIGVREASKLRLESRMAHLFTTYKHGKQGALATEQLIWRLNLAIVGCTFEGQRRGWMSYFSHMNDYTLLRHFDRLVATLWRRHGVDPQARARVHSFITALAQAKRKWPDPEIVLNLDSSTFGEQKRILQDYFGLPHRYIEELPPEEVGRLYRTRIRGAVLDLERDVGTQS